MIWNLPVDTIDAGLSNVSVFVGYTESLDAAAADGALELSELEAADAVGMFLGDVTLGMVIMKAQRVEVDGTPVTSFNNAALRFFALEGEASTGLGLVGVPSVELSSTMINSAVCGLASTRSTISTIVAVSL